MFDTLASTAITLGATVTALGVLWRTGATRAMRRALAWLWHRNVVEPGRGFLRSTVQDVVDNGVSNRLQGIEGKVGDLRQDTQALLGLVADHTASDTRQFAAINDRLAAMEATAQRRETSAQRRHDEETR